MVLLTFCISFSFIATTDVISLFTVPTTKVAILNYSTTAIIKYCSMIIDVAIDSTTTTVDVVGIAIEFVAITAIKSIVVVNKLLVMFGLVHSIAKAVTQEIDFYSKWDLMV